MNAREPMTGTNVDHPAATTRWASWVNLILGVILFISPWYSVTWFNSTSSWNAWILGICIVLVAIWALSSAAPAYVSWINLILGIWVFISPWVLRFASASNLEAWTAWVVGALVFLMAAYIMTQNRAPDRRATA